MIIIAFFFLLRPGEYTGASSNTTSFTLKDTHLFVGRDRIAPALYADPSARSKSLPLKRTGSEERSLALVAPATTFRRSRPCSAGSGIYSRTMQPPIRCLPRTFKRSGSVSPLLRSPRPCALPWRPLIPTPWDSTQLMSVPARSALREPWPCCALTLTLTSFVLWAVGGPTKCYATFMCRLLSP